MTKKDKKNVNYFFLQKWGQTKKQNIVTINWYTDLMRHTDIPQPNSHNLHRYRVQSAGMDQYCKHKHHCCKRQMWPTNDDAFKSVYINAFDLIAQKKSKFWGENFHKPSCIYKIEKNDSSNHFTARRHLIYLAIAVISFNSKLNNFFLHI